MPQAHMVEKPLEPSGVGGLNDEEILKLKTLLDHSRNMLAHLMHLVPLALSGATNQLTPTSQFLHSCNPCLSNRKIMVANGSVATIAGVGDIRVTSTIILKNVLHVPKLSANQVSIKKLTKDLNCYATFSLSYFLEQESGKKIGLRREMAFTTSKLKTTRRKIYLHLFLVPQIRMLFGCIIAAQAIRHLMY
ncbi:uncharacterized protein [Cicer arietinum]|uniref:Uncharacterized protein LOC113786286 isoform X1 n=1 Tax=Cicer arietinum TaxID=3827 RepID=A0A3Q7YA91_CICAR|nr:uncharacterized protein LOC113786286 isoform X1 [Cicer arietinum]